MSTEKSSHRCPRCGGPAYLDVINLKCDACRSIVGVTINEFLDNETTKTVKTGQESASHASHFS